MYHWRSIYHPYLIQLAGQILDDKARNQLQERIAEMKQFMTLTEECTKNIFVNCQTERTTINDFQIDHYIGKGSLGKIYSVSYSPNGKSAIIIDVSYAMKIIKKQKLLQKSSSLFSIESLIHPFITKVRFAFQNMANIYIMTQYMVRGQFFYHIRKATGKLQEQNARYYAAQLLLAIEFIHHKKGLSSIFLKPEKILIDDDGNIKLNDFGLLKYFNKRQKIEGRVVIMPQYVAPEVHLKKQASPASDWYSFGVVVYEMLIGKVPFYSKNQINQKHAVSIPNCLSAQAKSLLEGLLKFSPQKRLGSNGSHQIRSHPFFKYIDFQKLYNKQIEAPLKQYILQQIMEDYDEKSSMYEKSSLKNSQIGARGIKSEMHKQWKKIQIKKVRDASPETANTSQPRKTNFNTASLQI